MTTPTPPDNRIRFDKTINLGHLLTMAAFLVTAMLQWNLIDKRVLVLEEARTSQRERDVSQDNSSRDNFQAVKEALKDLRTSVEKVADKLETRK